MQAQHICEHRLFSFPVQVSNILPIENKIQCILLFIALGPFMYTFKLRSKLIHSVQLVLSRKVFKMPYCHLSVLFQGQHIFLTK